MFFLIIYPLQTSKTSEEVKEVLTFNGPTLKPIEKDDSFLTGAKPYKSSQVPISTVLFDKGKRDQFSEMFQTGPVSLLGGYLTSLGYDLDFTMNNPLNSSMLANYDLVVLYFPQFNYTVQEINDILDYVDNGGKLLLIGRQTETPWFHTNVYLNSVATKFGITFDDTSHYKRFAFISSLDHPIAYNIGDIILSGTGVSVESEVDVAFTDLDGTPIVGNTTYGSGEVYFLSGEDTLRNLFDVQGHTIYHFQFGLNLFNWITDNPLVAYEDYDYIEVPLLDYTLNEEELSKYNLYLGDFHSHCDEGSSDSYTPIATQMSTYNDRFYDFMTLTDHTTDHPTDAFEPADLTYQNNEYYRNNFLWIPGFELSFCPHHTVFPSTDQILVASDEDNMTYATQFYHDRGAFIFRAHPVLDPRGEDDVDEFINHESRGLDGFEIFNSGWLGDEEGGIGEYAYEMPFLATSDAHSAGAIGRAKTFIFAENNTIPSIIDAIIHRRIVAYGDFQGYFEAETDYIRIDTFIGDKIWLDQLDAWKDSVISLAPDVIALVDSYEAAGWDSAKITTAREWIDKSADAMLDKHLSFGKAYRSLQNAVASLFTLDISVVSPGDLESVSDNINFNMALRSNDSSIIPDAHVTVTVTKASVLDDFNAEVFQIEEFLTAEELISIYIDNSQLSPGDYRIKITTRLNDSLFNAESNEFIDYTLTSSSSSAPPYYVSGGVPIPITTSTVSSSTTGITTSTTDWNTDTTTDTTTDTDTDTNGNQTPGFSWFALLTTAFIILGLKKRKVLE